jgi:HD superfamily phosphohydrolase
VTNFTASHSVPGPGADAADPYDEYGRSAVKTFTLSVTGGVRLYGPEIDIVNTGVFQRLGGIRQLGSAHLVYRGAVHTRLEHSIGTVHAAQRIIDAYNANPKKSRPRISGTAWRLARLGALLHDITHIPFSHTLEDELHLLERHDENESRLQEFVETGEIGAVLRDSLGRRDWGSQTEYDLLIALLRHPDDDNVHEHLGELAFVADIVGNTVCADALDYIPRDLTNCGMPVAIGDRFLDFFDITPPDSAEPADRNRMALRLDKKGVPRPDVESSVMQLLNHRYELVERVFFHHAKNAASAMLGRAVQLSGFDAQDINFWYLSDDTLLLALAEAEVAEALGVSTDAEPEDRRAAAELARDLMTRQLFKLVYLGVADDDPGGRAEEIHSTYAAPRTRLALEDEFADRAGVSRGDVVVHIPSPRMLAKPAKVRVLPDRGGVVTLERWDRHHSGRLERLTRAHERLWRVAVYMHRKHIDTPTAVELLIGAATSQFGLTTRFRLSPPPDPYLSVLFDQLAGDRGWPVDVKAAAVAEAAGMSAYSAESTSKDRATELLELAVRRATGRLEARTLESHGQRSLLEDDA